MLIYEGILCFRNHLYNIGHYKSFSFTIPTISVGNLTVGGTGKTPHIEWLITQLLPHYSIATLSRGYGRKSRGFLLANENTTVQKLGDEPMQMYQKFKNKIEVAVCDQRAIGIPMIAFEKPEVNLILLDDAYQHRKVKPKVNILLCNYENPFYDDELLPIGKLREYKKGANRADIVIVSKCPLNISAEDKAEITTKIKKYSDASAPIFFSTMQLGQPICFNNSFQKTPDKILGISALANNEAFKTSLAHQFNLVAFHSFPDHYSFKREDIEAIIAHAKKENAAIICTEKDKAKLVTLLQTEELDLFWYLPIEVQFLSDPAVVLNSIYQLLD